MIAVTGEQVGMVIALVMIAVLALHVWRHRA